MIAVTVDWWWAPTLRRVLAYQFEQSIKHIVVVSTYSLDPCLYGGGVRSWGGTEIPSYFLSEKNPEPVYYAIVAFARII